MRLGSLTVVVLFSFSAHAGIGSMLARMSRVGRLGSAAVKLSRTAKLARLAGGVSRVVVAERAAASLGGLALDGAGYVARANAGELWLLAKRGGAPMAVDDVAQAAQRLGTNPTVVLDPSVAASPDVLRTLPADVELFISDGARPLPVSRVERNGVVEFVVEHGETALDLADYAAGLVPDYPELPAPEDSPLLTGLIGLGVLGAWALWRRRRANA